MKTNSFAYIILLCYFLQLEGYICQHRQLQKRKINWKRILAIIDDEKFLKSRLLKDTIPSEDDNANFCEGKIGIIVTTNAKREMINLEKLRKLLPEKEEYVCLATDNITNRDRHIPIPDTVSYSKTKGMMKNLIIRETAPVMITTNHKTARFKEDGIVNGAKGYIDHIQVSKENPDVVEVIWVVFQNEDIGSRCYRRDTTHEA